MTKPAQATNAPGQQLTAPVPAPKTIGSILQSETNQSKLREAVSGGLDPARFVRLCIATLQKNPKLAQCDPYTVFGAMMTAASLGLEPNTPLGHAYLIPYQAGRFELDDTGKKRWVTYYECQFQIGYRGFVKLMYESPLLLEMQAEAVHKNDDFKNKQGTNTMLEFEKHLDGPRGPLKAAFCYIKLARPGSEHVGQAMMVLPLEEIHKIRNKSQTYRTLTKAVADADSADKKRKAEAKLAETPWVEWEDDMAAKSAIKKMVKQLSISPRVTAAANIDDMGETGKLDLRAMSDLATAKDAADGGAAPLLEQQAEEVLNATVEAEPAAEEEPVKNTAPKSEAATQTKPARAREAAPATTAAPVVTPTTQAPDFGD